MARQKVIKFHLIVLSILLLVIPNSIYAAITGKIAGTITDSKSGEVLPGANVFINAEWIDGKEEPISAVVGAASDYQGDYYIINISPGTYTVVCQIIGYATQKIEKVMVYSNRTTTVDFKMQQSTLEMEEVVVVKAAREVIKQDVSASKYYVTSEEIESLPLEGLDEILSTQVGIGVSSGADGSGFRIRGGHISETAVIVDGVSLMNERTQVAISSINMTAINEIEVLTGGFNAEFGDVRSGVINITTKENINSFSFRGDFRMSPPAKKHFGPSPFSPQGPFWQVYAGDKAFTGVTRADVESGEYPFEFIGWNQVAINNAKDNIPDNDYTPQEALEIWKWRHRDIKYGNKPDYIADFTFSGPTPFKKIGYMFSQRYENSQYYLPLSRKAYTNAVTQLKLIFTPSDKLKLRFINLYNYEDGTGGGGGYTASKAAFNGSRESVVSMSHLVNNPRNIFLESAYNPIQNYTYVSSVGLSYLFSKSTFMNLSAEMFSDRTIQEPIESRDSTGIKLIGNVWYDEAPRGQPDSYGDQWDQFNQCALGGLGRGQNHSRYRRYKFSGSIVSQVNKYNHLKSGFDLKISEFRERELFNEGGDIYPREQMPSQYFYYTATPIKASAYIQDKLEFEGMIANVGMRVDYYNPRENPFDLSDPLNTPFESSYYQQMGSFDSLRVDKRTGKIRFSPRVGISHPISDKSKIYFNYGHFYQIPDKSYYYNVAPEGSGHLNIIPNVLLEWPKTIQYEVGYEHNIADQFLFHLGTYYKDVSDEVVELDIRSGQLGTGTVQVTSWSNNQYRDIRGIELRLEKNQGRFFTFYANFEYAVSSTGRTGLFGIYEDQQLMEEQRNMYDQQRSFPTPSFQLNLALHTPSQFGPELLGANPLGAWRASAIYGWSDGGMALYDANAPLGDRHWMEFTDWSNTDLMIEKVIDIKSARITLYSQITNLFNQKRLYNVQYDIEYKSSLHLPWEMGDQKGNDKYGDFKQDYLNLGWYSWTQFLNPRDVFVGMRISF